MKKQKFQTVLLIGIVLAIIGALYYNFYLKLQIEKISQLRTEIASKTTKLQELTAKQNTIDDEIELLNNENNTLEDQIPDKYSSKPVVLYFYNLIKNYGVSSDTLSLNEATSKDNKGKVITASLKVSGSYQNVWNFIDSVEKAPRKYNITQCSIAQSTDGASTATLKIELYAMN